MKALRSRQPYHSTSDSQNDPDSRAFHASSVVRAEPADPPAFGAMQAQAPSIPSRPPMNVPEYASVTYEVIGVVRSPFTSLEGMPLQPVAAQEVRGQIELHPKHRAALKDLDGFSHLWVVAHRHRSEPAHGTGGAAVLDAAPRVEAGDAVERLHRTQGTAVRPGQRQAADPERFIRRFFRGG